MSVATPIQEHPSGLVSVDGGIRGLDRADSTWRKEAQARSWELSRVSSQSFPSVRLRFGCWRSLGG
ncbi:MAG: hypothetical protein QG597_433 [Actinomycetota bacterium]|nr:hypothetical protein [Actinomycetota bacterium]